MEILCEHTSRKRCQYIGHSKGDLKKEMEGLIMAAKLRPSLKNEGYK